MYLIPCTLYLSYGQLGILPVYQSNPLQLPRVNVNDVCVMFVWANRKISRKRVQHVAVFVCLVFAVSSNIRRKSSDELVSQHLNFNEICA